MSLRNSIRARLVVLMLVPALALVALAATQLQGTIRQAAATDRFDQLIELSTAHLTLLHTLQEERVHTVAVQFVDDAEPARTGLQEARAQTDQALTAVRDGIDADGIRALDDDVSTAHDAALAAVDIFVERRQPVDELSGSVLALDTLFQLPFAAILTLDDTIAPLVVDPELAGRQQVRFAFTRLKSTVVDRAQVVLLASTGDVDRTSAVRQAAQLVGQQVLLIELIERLGTPAEIDRMVDVPASGVRANGGGLVGLVTINPAGETAEINNGLLTDTLPAPEDQVTDLLADAAELREAESAFAADLGASSQQQRRVANRALVVLLAVALAAVLFVLLVVVAVSRGVIAPLRRLTALSQRVGLGLPETVEQVAAGAAIPDSEFAAAANADLVGRSDELGDLARAIRASTETAVLVATEQAQTRAGVAKTIVDVARREQSLVEQQLALLDRLEDAEVDPEQLSNLFGLDHLATRMRRNAENLLLFASGELPGSPTDAPTSLVDVVRGAAAEIEEYVRVDVNVGLAVMVAGYAATPVSHLLAELVENATLYSAPTTRVQITARRTGDGVTVRVRDHGIGLDERELAAARLKLAETPLLEAAESRRLGLYVVGLLAARLGIGVDLAAAEDGAGTIVDIALPGALFIDAATPQPMAWGDPAVRPVLPVHRDPAPPIPGLLSPAALVEVSPITVAPPEVPPPSPAWPILTEQPSALPSRGQPVEVAGAAPSGAGQRISLSLARESGVTPAQVDDLDQGLLGAFFDAPSPPRGGFLDDLDTMPEPAAPALPPRAQGPRPHAAAPAPQTGAFTTPSWAPTARPSNGDRP